VTDEYYRLKDGSLFGRDGLRLHTDRDCQVLQGRPAVTVEREAPEDETVCELCGDDWPDSYEGTELAGVLRRADSLEDARDEGQDSDQDRLVTDGGQERPADVDAESDVYQFEADERGAFLQWDALERAGVYAVQHEEMEIAAEYFDQLFLLQAQAEDLADRYVDDVEAMLDNEELREEQALVNTAIIETKRWAWDNGHPFAEWFGAEYEDQDREDPDVATDGGVVMADTVPPAERCQACGEGALRIAADRVLVDGGARREYRCGECHAGGAEILTDDGAIVRRVGAALDGDVSTPREILERATRREAGADADCEPELVPDGGRARWAHDDAVAQRSRAGRADQDATCPHGDAECAQPGTAPCFDCLMGGGER
jgi:hypothetical protein